MALCTGGDASIFRLGGTEEDKAGEEDVFVGAVVREEKEEEGRPGKRARLEVDVQRTGAKAVPGGGQDQVRGWVWVWECKWIIAWWKACVACVVCLSISGA